MSTKQKCEPHSGSNEQKQNMIPILEDCKYLVKCLKICERGLGVRVQERGTTARISSQS